jgi:metal-dependent amidase/aminoacylase/carboxypeptidase family protein
VIADPRFRRLAPDYAFAIHNLPGLPLGAAALAEGPVNCASRGLQIRFRGRTAHAAEPERGVSPMAAVTALMPGLGALAERVAEETGDLAMATVTHARLGAAAFGVAPGEAEIWVTLRTLLDGQMAALDNAVRALVERLAAQYGIASEVVVSDDFRHCENSRAAVAILRRTLDRLGIAHCSSGLPMRASEDFGRFSDQAESAMLFLGAGEDSPALHNPDYDFPDALISQGVAILHGVARQLLDG